MHSGLREPVLFSFLSRKICPAMGWAGAPGSTGFGLAMGAGMCVGWSNASSSYGKVTEATDISPLLNSLCSPNHA